MQRRLVVRSFASLNFPLLKLVFCQIFFTKILNLWLKVPIFTELISCTTAG